MKAHQQTRLGGICSILLGLSYLAIGLNYVLLVPPDQQGGNPPTLILPSFAQNPIPLQLQAWLFFLGAPLGIAAVLAISESISSSVAEWVRWSSVLACIGFAVSMFNDLNVLSKLPMLAQAYVGNDAAAKAAATIAFHFVFLDPQGWLRYGAVGIWVLVISLIGLRSGSCPRSLAYIGLGVSGLYWLLVLGSFAAQPLLILIGAGIGGIVLAPIWYIGMGLYLLRGHVRAQPTVAAGSYAPR